MKDNASLLVVIEPGRKLESLRVLLQGFDQIDRIRFSATWDNWVPDPDAVLYIDDIYVTDGTPRPEEKPRPVDPKTGLALTWGRLKVGY